MMSGANPSTSGSGSQRLALLALLDTESLKNVKVLIKRRDQPAVFPSSPCELERDLDDPALLVIHYRPGLFFKLLKAKKFSRYYF